MKVKCWKCGGKGWLYDHGAGIFTFGIGYLLQALDQVTGDVRWHPDQTCPICHGKGYQETKE